MRIGKSNPHNFLPPFFGHTIRGIRKEDERGLLYYLDYKSNYYRLEKYLKLMATPACSTFLVKNKTGEALMGRNYDFVHFKYNKRTTFDQVTGLMIVVRSMNRKAKYKSLGMVDGCWLDPKGGKYFEGVLSDGVTNITPLALAPFLIMDGVNEAGLAVSIMHLPTENEWTEVDYRDPKTLNEIEKQTAIIYKKKGEEPKRLDYKVKSTSIAINTIDKKTWTVNKKFATHQKEPGKEEIFHPVLMRKMLDFTSSVDEAIELAKTYNVVSPMPDNDYHIFICDKSHHSALLEWVNNKLVVINTTHGTNFAKARKDLYGYGHDRDEIIEKRLKQHGSVLSEEETNELLYDVMQDIRIKRFASCSLWSNIYNLNQGTMDLRIFMDFSKVYKYKI